MGIINRVLLFFYNDRYCAFVVRGGSLLPTGCPGSLCLE